MDSLLHITDIHFWEIVKNPLRLLNKRFLGNLNVWYRRQYEFVTGNAPAFAEEVARAGVSTVLITGDFTCTATPGEYEQARRFVQGLTDAGLRVWVIQGNHDVYTFESVRRKRFERYLGEWMPAPELPAGIQLPGGTPLVLVPTCCPNLLSSKGRITQDQADRAAALIRACERPVLVAGHYPVLNATYSYVSKAGRRLRNAGALEEALAATRQPLLYLAGHVHRFSYVTDPRVDNVCHLTTGGFLREAPEIQGNGQFSEIHATDTGFTVVHHVHRDTWQTETVKPRPPGAPS